MAICVNCGLQGTSARECERCGSDYWGRTRLDAVVTLPAGAMRCPDCLRDDLPLRFHVCTELTGLGMSATPRHRHGYVCGTCAQRRTIRALLWTAALGWWSLESLWMAPAATVRNWLSLRGAPLDARTWGAMSIGELVEAREADYEQQRARGASAHHGPGATHGSHRSAPPPPGRSSRGASTPPGRPPGRPALTPLTRLSHDQQQQVLSLDLDVYALVGIRTGMDDDERQRRYRQAMKRHHPDLNPDDPGAAERMVRINRAWKVLGDPDMRAAYEWRMREEGIR